MKLSSTVKKILARMLKKCEITRHNIMVRMKSHNDCEAAGGYLGCFTFSVNFIDTIRRLRGVFTEMNHSTIETLSRRGEVILPAHRQVL